MHRATRRICLHIIGVAAALGATRVASAASIGINFVGGGGAGGNPGSLPSGTSAGVVPQTNWNNLSGTTSASPALTDNSGSVVPGISIAYTAGGGTTSAPNPSTGTGGDNGMTGDDLLMNGYIYFGNGNPGPTGENGSLSVAGVPYSSYQVYAYFWTGINDYRGFPGRSGYITDGAGGNPTATGAQTYYFKTIDFTTASPKYVQTMTTSGDLNSQSTTANPGADYAVFNETSPTFSLTGAAFSNFGFNDKYWGLSGIQIVDTSTTPEPGSLTLLASCAAGLLVRRRARQQVPR